MRCGMADYNNKIQMGDGTVLLDLSGDTATASDVAQGKTFHDATGALITGTAPAPLFPQAVVTTDAGASVTATLDDTTVGPVVAGEDGVATLDLPSFGTWTLTAALDEKTVSDAVEVSEVRQFEVELPIAPDVPEGAVAAYFVNAADGSDESGNGHPLTLQNCTVESGSITGKSYLQITNNLSGNVLYTQNPRAEAPFAEVEEDIRGLSFSAWIKNFALFPTQSGSSTQSGSGLAVVGQENTDYPTTVGKNIYSPLLTFKQNNTNYIDLRYSFPNDRLAAIQSGNVDAYFPDMTDWTHIVNTISLSQIFLYVNGIKYGPLALDSYSTAPLDNLNHVKSSSCPLHLGTPITASYYSNTVIYCAGLKMSNIRLYARALTDDEVSALYNNGAGV